MRTIKDSTGRLVCDLEFDFNNDGSAFVSSAVYADDLTDAPDAELDYLSDAYPELCDEAALESAIMRAEAHYEGER